MSAHEAGVVAYGLARPGWDEALASLERVFGVDAASIWKALLATAGVADAARDDGDGFVRLVAAFVAHEHPVVRLCGQALTIRIESFRHLADAQLLIRSAP